MTVTDRLAPTSLLGRLMAKLSGGVIRRDLQKRLARLKVALATDPGAR